MKATGVVLSIPMPGHPYVAQAQERSSDAMYIDEAARSKLDELIAAHDVVFNLTDSREAR